MFKDIQRSKELIHGFKKENIFECDLNVSVCAMGAWPNTSIQPIKIPNEIEIISNVFKTYYLSRFNGRKLRYQMDKSKGDVQLYLI